MAPATGWVRSRMRARSPGCTPEGGHPPAGPEARSGRRVYAPPRRSHGRALPVPGPGGGGLTGPLRGAHGGLWLSPPLRRRGPGRAASRHGTDAARLRRPARTARSSTPSTERPCWPSRRRRPPSRPPAPLHADPSRRDRRRGTWGWREGSTTGCPRPTRGPCCLGGNRAPGAPSARPGAPPRQTPGPSGVGAGVPGREPR